MKPELLAGIMEKKGRLETYEKGQIYHAQDFPETLFMLKEGYVKRYQVTKADKKVIELIYGPTHIFPLTQLYKKLFNADHNQENLVYVYQAMTDIKIRALSVDVIAEATEKDPRLFMDLFYEAGLRLKSNINQLASNALTDNYKKVAHLLVWLSEEFGVSDDKTEEQIVKISVPLEVRDVEEQLNISNTAAESSLSKMEKQGLIKKEGEYIWVLDTNLLKGVYL